MLEMYFGLAEYCLQNSTHRCESNLSVTKNPSSPGNLHTTGSANTFAASSIRVEFLLLDTRLSEATQRQGFSGISLLNQIAIAVILFH